MVDAKTVEMTDKKAGKVVAVGRATVSADAKTMTVKSEDKGRGTTTTWVATKQ